MSGAAQTEEKNKIIFQENQTGLLQPHFETHRGMMVKLDMISGPFQEILFTVNLTKVRSKKEVIDEARTKGVKVNFASLMDMCHLKNAELEAKHQKYKGRLVLRGDICKRRLWILCSFH